jgi:5'-methylthioadenosine nucleosidase
MTFRVTKLKNFIFLFFLFSVSIAEAKQPDSEKNLPVKKVMLVVAMDSEARPIISKLALQKLPQSFSNLPMQGYVGKYADLDILLVTNGMDPVNKVQNVGTQAATLSTYLGIEYFHPDFIISIGTAGGVEKNGAREKDIYASEKIYFYDRRIASKDYREYGLGAYPSTPMAKKLGFKAGIICSGDSFDDNRTDYNIFIKQNCSAIDMEAAGVAWVSQLTHTPVVAIKGITNFVKGDNIHAQYQKNLPVVTLRLSEKLEELLKYFSAKNS